MRGETLHLLQEKKLNGDEGYQTVPAPPSGKCRLQTSLEPSKVKRVR